MNSVLQFDLGMARGGPAKLMRTAGVVIAAVVLSACGGGGGSGDVASPEPRASVLSAPSFAEIKLPIGLADRPYEAVLKVQGGTSPMLYELIEGALPDGVLLDPATGVLSGRPPGKGTYAFRVRARDARGVETTQRFQLFIDATQGGSPSAPKRLAARTDERAQALSRPQPLSGPQLADLRVIVAGMPEGSWQRVNLNSYSSAWTPVALRTLLNGGAHDPSKIILAWSSFAWDSNRGNLFLYGGGHANYRGNDTYLWNGTTRLWERSSLPSDMVQTNVVNAIDGADKAPASAHTYDNTVFLPILDRFLVLGGAADPNGGHFLTATSPSATRVTGPYLFDPNRADGNKVGGTTGSHVKRVAPFPEIVGGNMWQNRESWLHANANSTPPVESLTNSCTGYAVEGGRDIVYLRTQHRLFRYEIVDINNPASDRWQQVGRYFFGGSGGMGTCAFDPARRWMVSTYETATHPFIFWNLSALSPFTTDVLVAPTDPTGEFPTLLSSGAINLQFCGLEHDPVRGNFKLWCGDGRVWTLNPPATPTAAGWTITKAPTPAGSVPSESIGTGILGKWKYIPNLDVFMGLLDAELGNIWIYKPVGWVSPWGDGNLAPTVTLTSPAAGASYALGAQVALSATAADADGDVAKVEFFADGVKLGESNSRPFGLVWTPGGAGGYAITARATDNAAATTVSAPVNITVNPAPNVPPVAVWVEPSDGLNVARGTPVTLQVNVSDSDGVVGRVEYFAGSAKIGEATIAPWSFVWIAPPVGSHVLTAVAIDDRGSTGSTGNRTIIVNPGPGSGTVTLQRGSGFATADTYLSTYHRTLNFGTATALLDERDNYSGLFRFAIFQREGGPVPDGATIDSAVLSLYKSTAYDMSYAVHRMLVSWSETGATWNQRQQGASWSVVGANGVGTDYSVAADATASVGWDPGWIDFNVTAGVQQMSGGAANHGWRLRGVGGSNNALKQIHGSEFAGSPALRPKLVVSYSGASGPPAGNLSPTVDLTAPGAGSSFTLGGQVALSANANDSDGSVARVEFFANGAKLGESLASPYGMLWAPIAAGSYSITARATDNAGASTTSAAVGITINAAANTPPSVAWLAPADGLSVVQGAAVTLQASAGDSDGTVSRVEYFAGGAKIGEALAAPWSFVWAAPPVGTHVLTAMATDNAGATAATGSRTIRVNANSAPTVDLTAPGAGSSFTLGAQVALSANANDSDGNVARVEFFANGARLGESLGSPYGMLWAPSAAGNYSVTARATDNAGASTTSAAVGITINAAANTPPSVAWLAPADGLSVVQGVSVTLQASASDSNGTVSRVEYFAGGAKIGEALAAPWSFVWVAPPAGAHVLTAMATDNAGATATTGSRSITVIASGGGGGSATLQRGSGFATADTYLSTFHRTLNFGSRAGVFDERQNYSGLYRFTIFQSEGGPVPNGATITSAVLSLYKSTAYDMTYSVHRMLMSWTETGATWNQRAPGLAWSVAGANGVGLDFAATADATASVGWDPGWVDFNVTVAVQQMSGGAANFGWRLRGVSGYTSALKQIHGSEFTGSAALRPKLVITWQ